MEDIKIIHDRFEDHSKRILLLENSQKNTNSRLEELTQMGTTMRDALFGSSRPGETSIKEQLQSIASLIEKLATTIEVNNEESVKARESNRDRIFELERWRKTIDANKKDSKQFAMQALVLAVDLRRGHCHTASYRQVLIFDS